MNVQIVKSAEYQSTNPATGKILQKFESLTDAELETKLAAAAKCFETWRHKSYAERAVIVAKAAALMHEQADTLAQTMTLEMGKRINEARGEIRRLHQKRWVCRVYSRESGLRRLDDPRHAGE